APNPVQMTDFHPDSAWAEPVLHTDDDSWESTRPVAVVEARGTAPPQRRPAPALAADINELLESMARKRVPRLDGVRERLQRVRQAAQWLAEMDHDLLQRRRGSNNDVTLRAMEELARRGIGMHERLQSVHRLCNQARAVHGLSERMAAERAALWTTLQDRVLPACGRLDEAVQPLLHAASYRALV